MAANKCTTVVGVFEERSQAEKAVEALRSDGFRRDQIGVVVRDSNKSSSRGKGKKETHTEEAIVSGSLAGPAVVGYEVGNGPKYKSGKSKSSKAEETTSIKGKKESKAPEGAATGAVAGGLLGGVLGAAAVGLIPGIGPILAAGALAATLGGAAAGAAAGGVVGGLIGLGIPEEDVKFYNKELKAGRTLVTVKAGRRCEEARAILRRFGAYDAANSAITTSRSTAATRTSSRTSSRPAVANADEQSMELREEELQPRKQSVRKGEVRVHKDVITERKTIQVPVTREVVVVERRPARGQSATNPDFRDEEIRIPVKEERVSVEKRPVVKEEVRIGKRRISETKEVSGTVRKEKARIDRQGDVTVRDESSGRR